MLETERFSKLTYEYMHQVHKHGKSAERWVPTKSGLDEQQDQDQDFQFLKPDLPCVVQHTRKNSQINQDSMRRTRLVWLFPVNGVWNGLFFFKYLVFLAIAVCLSWTFIGKDYNAFPFLMHSSGSWLVEPWLILVHLLGKFYRSFWMSW